jgi:hypothetical protein
VNEQPEVDLCPFCTERRGEPVTREACLAELRRLNACHV